MSSHRDCRGTRPRSRIIVPLYLPIENVWDLSANNCRTRLVDAVSRYALFLLLCVCFAGGIPGIAAPGEIHDRSISMEEDFCNFRDCSDLGDLFSVRFGSSFDTWSCWRHSGGKKLAKRCKKLYKNVTIFNPFP
jgi:hypothetical protein